MPGKSNASLYFYLWQLSPAHLYTFYLWQLSLAHLYTFYLWHLSPAHLYTFYLWHLSPAHLSTFNLWQLSPAHLYTFYLWQLSPAHLYTFYLCQLSPAQHYLWQLSPAHLYLWQLRRGWVFLERTRILSGIQFTTYFIEIFVVETKRFVSSFVNVILTRQTCGQRSSRTAESKHQTIGKYFSEQICYMFLISKCRGD